MKLVPFVLCSIALSVACLAGVLSFSAKTKPAPPAAVRVEDQPTITLQQFEITARGLAFQAMDTGFMFGYAAAGLGATKQDAEELRVYIRSNRMDYLTAWFAQHTALQTNVTARTNTIAPAQ